MRPYNIVVSGILLIFSINDFALAAPVLVPEKHQAHVDVAHIPKDVITVVEKSGKEELEKLLDQYFKAMGNRLSCQTHMRRRAQRHRGPSMGRRAWCRDHYRTQRRQQPIQIS